MTELDELPAKVGIRQVRRTGVRFVRLKKWKSDKMDKSDGQMSDLSVYILASSDRQVGHLSVRLVRLKSDSDTSPSKLYITVAE